MDTYENQENQQTAQTQEQPVQPQQPVAPQEPPIQPQEPPVQFQQPPVQPQQSAPQSQFYHGVGAGVRENPYGTNPYTVNNPYQPQQPRYEANSWQAQYTGPAPAQPQPQPKPKKKKTGKVWKTVLAAVLVVALVATGCGITAASVNSYWNSRNQETNKLLQQMDDKIKELEEFVNDNSYTGNGNSTSGTPNGSADGSLTPAQVYAKCRKSVVAISNQVTTNIFGQISQTASSGSGFIISENGYIVTNYHVVEGEDAKLTVITYDGTEYSAQLVGGDANNDLAVLKVEATGLPAVALGSSDALIVGDQVAAIGNPLGELTNSLTVGYISAKDRSITTDGSIINMLQTDAAINSGNSGGPLFNMKGEVIGITSAKYSGTTSSGAVIEGIGFAIPMDDVAKKIEDLVTLGYISGAYLGVMVRDMDPSLANYGIPIGAYVEEVTPGVSADRAGVQAKDVIVALGEYEIGNLNALTRALGNFKAGDTTTITVWRAGVRMELEITLDEKPRQ